MSGGTSGYTAQELAEACGCTVGTVRNLASKRTIPYAKGKGGHARYPASAMWNLRGYLTQPRPLTAEEWGERRIANEGDDLLDDSLE